jgi:hypothetical protein
MVQHSSPLAATSQSSPIKSETANLPAALTLGNPMNVNVSMNFNSHNLQYTTSGYGPNSAATNFPSSPYEPFYSTTPNGHYPFVNHSMENKTHRTISSSSSSCLPTDPVSSKQAMFLSAAAAAAAANYDYKDLSKLCDFFPTSSSPMTTNDRRK